MSTSRKIPLGPVMLDVAGTELTADDAERLAHPLVGGVILFARNFATVAQLAQLTQDIHAVRQPPLLIAVDQEGGRVQRFRDGFTALPAMRELGVVWDNDAPRARELAQAVGYVLAAELRAYGVDLSLTPVLDVDHGASSVIGDRAFHSNPRAISELALGLIGGLKRGDMSSVGKHYPGHGYVKADSHVDTPVDERTLAAIEACDLQPFRRLIENGLGGIMPAHVVYPDVDAKPAGFSAIWLKQILRERMGFSGMIFSDDMSMAGASGAGGIVERARAAFDAGCDMVLVCNDSQAADQLLTGLNYQMPATALARLARIHGRGGPESLVQLERDPRYHQAVAAVRTIGVQDGELPLYR